MAKRVPYTQLRNGWYHFRQRIPTDLRNHSHFANHPSTYSRSLKTRDPTVAMSKAAEAKVEFEELCEQLRSGVRTVAVASGQAEIEQKRRSTPISVVDSRFLKFYAKNFFQELVDEDQAVRLNASRDPDGLDAIYLERGYENALENMSKRRTKLRARDMSLVRMRALRIWEMHGIDGGEDTPQFFELCQSLIEAELDAIEVIQKRAESGRLIHKPDSPILDGVAETPLPTGDELETLATVAEKYLAVTPDLSDEWAEKVRISVRRFEECLGVQRIRDVRRRHIREFLDTCSMMPANYRSLFPGMTALEAIEANKKRRRPYPPISANTVKGSYLATVRKIFAFARDREIIEEDPSGNIRIDRASKQSRGTEFRYDELNRLFRLPLFVGCQSDSRTLSPGSHRIDDHRYWAPLIALFSGARATEIAQLQLSEVHLDHGSPHFQIQTNANDGRSLKTNAATRDVPIHHRLVDLGFCDYVARIRRSGASRLFPHWKEQGSRKLYVNDTGHRAFTRFVIPEISNRTDPKPTFHSFRHTFKREMQLAGVMPQYQLLILGHELPGMDSIYGRNQKFPVEVLYPAMQQVAYNDVDLSHLYR